MKVLLIEKLLLLLGSQCNQFTADKRSEEQSLCLAALGPDRPGTQIRPDFTPHHVVCCVSAGFNRRLLSETQKQKARCAELVQLLSQSVGSLAVLGFNCAEGNPGSPYLSSIPCPALFDSLFISPHLSLWLAFTLPLSMSLYIHSRSLSLSLARSLSRSPVWMNDMWQLWLRRCWANSVSLSNLSVYYLQWEKHIFSAAYFS